MASPDDHDVVPEAPGGPEPTPLARPCDGVPPVSVSADEITGAARKLAAGSGPFAVDAERASGFRYSNRAYLIQIRRAGAGTVLIDPVNHGGSPIDEVRRGVEVIRRAYEAQHAERRFTHYIEAGGGHVLSDEMWKRTREFFARYLHG